jgi:hypothetical protein
MCMPSNALFLRDHDRPLRTLNVQDALDAHVLRI